MESRGLSRTPSLPESSISFGISGRTQEVAEVVPPPTEEDDSATLLLMGGEGILLPI